MAVTLVLPRFFTLRFNLIPYLGVPENPAATLPPGYLKFEEKQILNPRAKFAAEPSQTGDGSLVNIRSCYNNKYWVAQQISPFIWITASADKPQEDPTKPACTLFKSEQGHRPELVLLFNVGMSMYLTLHSGNNNEWRYGIRLQKNAPAQGFSVVDWETLAILPPQVSFKYEGLDGNYLCSRDIDVTEPRILGSSRDWMQEIRGWPMISPPLMMEASYRIKSLHFGQDWRRTAQDWIWADGVEHAGQPWDILFSFIKISDSVFGLRNVGRNRFCSGSTRNGQTDCLSASYETLTRQVWLTVEERVLQREISDLSYRLSDSRIYQEEIQEVSHAFATNNSPDKESIVTLSYSSTRSRTTSWTDSKSSKFGVNVNLNITIVPKIVKLGIELSGESGQTFQWGESETTMSTIEATYTVVVPPLTIIKVTMMCTQAACDVPFSYTQRDLLPSGQRVTTIKHDGSYTGLNSFNFYFESSEEPLNGQGRLYM